MKTGNWRLALTVALLLGLLGSAGLLYGADEPSPTEKPRTAQETVREAMRLQQEIAKAFTEKEYEKAADLCAEFVKLIPNDPSGQYNLACAQARLGKRDEALASLAKAVELGFTDEEHIVGDEDLASLREDERFKKLVEKAAKTPRNPRRAQYEKGIDIEGLKTIEDAPKGGLRYRLRISPDASKEKPHRLIVWLHPSGGSMNNIVEKLSPELAKLGFALVVFSQKSFDGWGGKDGEQLDATLKALAKVEGLDANRPLLLGFSAGGQMAWALFRDQPGRWGGVALDAAYPILIAGGRVSLAEMPKDDAAKKTPIFALVGDKDGGAMIWKQTAPKFVEAGIPLTLEYVADAGHAWLFGKAQTGRFLQWLDDIAAGKLPEGTVGTAPEKVEPPAGGGNAARGPLLGVSLDGTTIDAVSEGSPAEKAGLKAGDKIEAIDGKKVADRDEIVAAIRAKKPGDSIEIAIDRDGKTEKVTAKLGG